MNPFVEALERAEKLLAEKYAEIERLRAALHEIAKNRALGDGAAQIARRALEQARKE